MSLLRSKAISLPSGDQRGCELLPLLVMRRLPVPSGLTVQMSWLPVGLVMT
jgi:hypothetical protein